MKIIISGHTGFLGSLLSEQLHKRGHTVSGIPRSLLLKTIELKDYLAHADIVVNLSGASIGKRWTNVYKQKIYQSRIDTTKCLVGAMSLLETKPKLFVSASGVGIYSQFGVHSEQSTDFDEGFLANVCRDWEHEALKANVYGIRTVIVRMAPVLDSDGGMMKQLLKIFGKGVGAIMGNGKQAMPWISSTDWLRALLHIVNGINSNGIYNLTAPIATNNATFSKLLARSVNKPLFFKIPSFLTKLLLGENASLVLEGQHATPQRLIDEGFEFRNRDIEDFFYENVKQL